MKDLPLLTLERAHEVCQYIIDVLRKMGDQIDGYFICPHATPDYVKKRSIHHFDQTLVCDCECIKPRLGMVFNALKAEVLTRENTDVYMIGDRSSDVQTALNVGGTGILVPFENEPSQVEKVRGLDQNHIYIAENFLSATQFIISAHKQF